MPRTRAQRRATEGLFVLGDDALRNVLTFLTPSVCARGPGATSKAMREIATSNQLQAARASGSYVLRPPDHGVVHALATAFGTREWPSKTVNGYWADIYDDPPPFIRLCVPTLPLRVTVHRVGSNVQNELGLQGERAVEYVQNFDAALVSRASIGSEHPAEAPDCSLHAGSYIEYELPFHVCISDFRIAFGNCCARDFGDWTFEAYVGDGRWTIMHHCSVSPWEHIVGPGEHGYQGARPGPEKIINVENDFIISTRFRIKLYGMQCMHVRSFELFGTILPHSNPHPAPPSPEDVSAEDGPMGVVHTFGPMVDDGEDSSEDEEDDEDHFDY